MQFCVLAKISRRSVSLWYQAEEKKYAPLPIKGNTEIPLFFYVNGNDFLFGTAAKERFLANDPKAFGNYFEIIKDPAAHFSIYGNKKPVKQLLYHGLEQCLSMFINSVLYKSDSIESYRPGFPLRFVFGPDLEDKEKTLVESLFSEAGYNNIVTLDYTRYLFPVLSQNKVIPDQCPVLFLNGVDGVLYLQLYKDIGGELTASSRLQGQGADPRVRILAQMIVEYIQANKSYLMLDIEKEVAGILSFTTSLLDNLPAMICGEVTLSDGDLHYYNVRRTRLFEQLLYDSNEHIIYSAIDQLLEQTSTPAKQVCILLGSEEINTTFLSERLEKVYPNIKGVTAYHAGEAMRFLFMEISANGYIGKKNVTTTVMPPVSRPSAPVAVKKIAPPPPIPKIPSAPPVPTLVKTGVAIPSVPENASNLNKLIDKTGTVTVKIAPIGRVKIDQKEYDAKSTVAEIAIGILVKVTGTEGKKYLLVERNGSPPLPFSRKN